MKKEDIQQALEVLGNSGIIVNGDLVLEKKVEYEVNNVESGGIGIQVNNSQEQITPLSYTDKEIQTAIRELQETLDEKNELLFRNKKQWWAIYKVLSTFCNYPNKMTAFESKMKELEVAKVDGKRDLSYDSLTAASKEVPQMATCSPSAWTAFKDINENYNQQFIVADFLMLKLGVKS